MESFLETSHPPRLPSECRGQRTAQASGPDIPPVTHQNYCSQRQVNFWSWTNKLGWPVRPRWCLFTVLRRGGKAGQWGNSISFVTGHLPCARNHVKCSMCILYVILPALTLPLSKQLSTQAESSLENTNHIKAICSRSFRGSPLT